MDVRVQADAVAVGRTLIAALLFVGKRPSSFPEAKFDDSVFGGVLRRRRTHSTFFVAGTSRESDRITITSTSRSQNIANDAVPLPQAIVQEKHESRKASGTTLGEVAIISLAFSHAVGACKAFAFATRRSARGENARC